MFQNETVDGKERFVLTAYFVPPGKTDIITPRFTLICEEVTKTLSLTQTLFKQYLRLTFPQKSSALLAVPKPNSKPKERVPVFGSRTESPLLTLKLPFLPTGPTLQLPVGPTANVSLAWDSTISSKSTNGKRQTAPASSPLKPLTI
jgi:hypothetical protein